MSVDDNGSVAVVVVLPTTPDYLTLLLNLFAGLSEEGLNNIKLLTFPMPVFNQVAWDHGRSIRANNLKTFLKNLIDECPNFPKNLNLEVVNLSPFSLIRRLIRIPREISIYKFEHEVKNSIMSVLLHDHSASAYSKIPWFRSGLLAWLHFNSFFSSYWTFCDFFDKETFRNIVLYNGRTPWELAMRIAAAEKKLSIKFYEHGVPKNSRFFLESYQPQDPGQNRDWLEYQLGAVSDDIKVHQISWSQSSLQLEENSEFHNRFLNFLDPNFKWLEIFDSKAPLATLFTSSIDDKTSNFGVHMNGWESQPKAFLKVANELQGLGYTPLVRIHPNAMNKSVWDLLHWIRLLKKNSIPFILPWQGPSAIEVIDSSSLVLTWSSTVVFSALLRGKPVINFAGTWYDNRLNIPRIRPQDDISEVIQLSQRMSPSTKEDLLRTYYYRFNRGHSYRYFPKAINLVTDESPKLAVNPLHVSFRLLFCCSPVILITSLLRALLAFLDPKVKYVVKFLITLTSTESFIKTARRINS